VSVSRLLRFRVPLGFLFAAWYLWLVWQAPPRNLVFCTVIVFAGCALRAWAAGYLLKGKRVAVGGPYAYVRNPLYLGSFIIGGGFCLTLYRRPLPPAVILFWAIYAAGFLFMYMTKSQAEEAELTRALGSDYETYRRKVPAILPVRGKVSGLGVQRFSSELYRRNREYQCLWGSLAVLVFLLWRSAHGL
jgi:protein-S-isoprenylcysteine O-methyltransferase Ste14